MKWVLENYEALVREFFQKCLYRSYSVNCNGIEYKKRLIEIAIDWNKEEIIFTFEKYMKRENDVVPAIISHKDKVYYTISHFQRFLSEISDEAPMRYIEILDEDLEEFMKYIVKRSLKLECEAMKN